MLRSSSPAARIAAALLAATLAAALATACGGDRVTSPSAPSTPLTPAHLAMNVVSGDAQVGAPGHELPEALRVQVVDDSGHAVAGVVVNFRVVSGGGSVYAGATSTDAQGRAVDWWTLGPASADTQRVEVRAVDPVTADRRVYATFRALTTPGGSFTVVVAPLGVPAGASGPATIAVDRSGGYAGDVAFAASGVPNGVTVSFAPASIVGEQAMASVVVAGGVSPGTYPITITGTGSGVPPQTTTLRLTVTAPATTAGALVNGQQYTGHITRAGQTDSYTITATQGELIALSLAELAGASADFYPWIRLMGPTGQVVLDRSNGVVAQITVNAPITGTYTVLVATEDPGRDAIGDYRLTYLKVAGPSVVPSGDEGGPMTNGINHTGALGVGDLDHWTFTASKGDFIALSVGEGNATADFYPWIRLVGPTGDVVMDRSNSVVAQISVYAPEAGTYTVIVATADPGNDASGDYRLTLALAKAPGVLAVSPGDQGGALTNGANHAGALGVGDLDQWTFTAQQGELIALSLAETTNASADFYPWIRLVGPTGEVVLDRSNSVVAQISVYAPMTGTYTVVVATADPGNDAVGDYRLTYLKVAGPSVVTAGDEGGPMTNGANHAGTLGVGDLDHWTFTASKGDFIALSMGEGNATADFYPWIRLVGPTGDVVMDRSNGVVAQISVYAPESGTYTVIVATADPGNDASGDYRLTLALAKAPVPPLIPAGDEGGPMKNGDNQTGTLGVGDLDQWTFTAQQGEFLALSMARGNSTADFYPWIRLVAPTGQVVQDRSNGVVAQISAYAPMTGTYTVVVATADPGNDASGDYRLTLVKAPGTLVVPTGDEGGALPNATDRTGTITVGDLDAWTFSATQGTTVVVNLARGATASADFYPWFRLIGPTGQVVADRSNATAAQLSFNAPMTGTYTLVVGTADPGNDATGAYTITVTGASASTRLAETGAMRAPPDTAGTP